MKKVILILVLIVSFPNAKEESPWVKQAALSTSIIMSWTSSGIVEGLKFSGRANSSFTGLDYHSWRAVQNIGIVSAPLISIHCGANSATYKNIAISNLVGWVVYERMISILNQGHFWGHHGDFHIQGKDFKRPSPKLESFLALSLSAGIYYTF